MSSMEILSNLPSDDLTVLDQLVLELSRRTKRSQSLEELVATWKSFVSQIEIGYADSIYDYTNDLSARDLLQEILNDTTPAVSKAVSALLEPVDDRFLRATVPVDKPILPATGNDKDVQAWWFRIPRNLTEQLEEDLKTE